MIRSRSATRCGGILWSTRSTPTFAALGSPTSGHPLTLVTLAYLARRSAALPARCAPLIAVRSRPEGRCLGLRGEGMSELLAAADVLVQSTVGLTVREAQVGRTRVISYGRGLGLHPRKQTARSPHSG